jgi:hypothetical protein
VDDQLSRWFSTDAACVFDHGRDENWISLALGQRRRDRVGALAACEEAGYRITIRGYISKKYVVIQGLDMGLCGANGLINLLN